MEVEVLGSNSFAGTEKVPVELVRMKKKNLQAVLEQCQRALQLLGQSENDDDNDDGAIEGSALRKEERDTSVVSFSGINDHETDKLCDLIKSRIDCIDFVEKMEKTEVSMHQSMGEESSSWDVVSKNDIWKGDILETDMEDYVLVRHEDIVDGIASFMAAYLLSLKETKDLTPDQLQEALKRAFSGKKCKGKFRKAWEGSKVIYNVASWGATAIGIYQNPVLFKAAAFAFWTSCDVMWKLF